MKTIAYQGVKGAFSYLTAYNEFGEGNHYTGKKTFNEVFDLVESKQADYAVIPIENSLIGSIYENYDLLNKFEIQILGEHFTKIEHCLMTIPVQNENKEERIKTIKKVLSHPKALEQCALFFRQHPWIEAVVSIDTAAAAEEIALKGDPACAAIASKYAGCIHQLEILKIGIQDDPRNYTRFVTIGKEKNEASVADKCSLLMQLKHIPGALSNVLMQFAKSEINLAKIESRPLRGSPFEYLFYMDLEFDKDRRQKLEKILNELHDKVQKHKILGIYKKGSLWTS